MTDIPPPPAYPPPPPPNNGPQTIYVQQPKKGGCLKGIGVVTLVVVGLFVLLIVAVAVGLSNKGDKVKPIGGATTTSPVVTQPGDTTPETVASAVQGMTMEKYTAVQTGMTVDEVNAIVQPANCEQLSETNIAGHVSFSYDCKDDAGIGNAFFIFYDGTVQSKSQFGLD